MSKKIGELAEAQFVVECCKRGLNVANVYGDSSRYDFFVETGGNMFRVQVKTTKSLHCGPKQVKGCYTVLACWGCDTKTPYTKQEIDVIAAYVSPEDAWYIIPVEKLKTGRIRLYPHIPKHEYFSYEIYRENWEHFTGNLV